MKYYLSTQHNVMVRTDADKNEAFIKRESKEFPSDPENPIVNDAIIENQEISIDEYSESLETDNEEIPS
jgi:hypothetical protein